MYLSLLKLYLCATYIMYVLIVFLRPKAHWCACGCMHCCIGAHVGVYAAWRFAQKIQLQPIAQNTSSCTSLGMHLQRIAQNTSSCIHALLRLNVCGCACACGCRGGHPSKCVNDTCAICHSKVGISAPRV